jgi:hypothetical protein
LSRGHTAESWRLRHQTECRNGPAPSHRVLPAAHRFFEGRRFSLNARAVDVPPPPHRHEDLVVGSLGVTTASSRRRAAYIFRAQRTGASPTPNALLDGQRGARTGLFDAAASIGCRRLRRRPAPTPRPCLFTAATVTQTQTRSPPGQPERDERTVNMVGGGPPGWGPCGARRSGSCSNHGTCEAVCPKGVPAGVHRRTESRRDPRGIPSASGSQLVVHGDARSARHTTMR